MIRRSRFAPGLRAKVLLASSALLLIPWIGYAFVAEMERVLTEGQTRTLADSARAVAALVAERTRTLNETPGGARAIAPALVRPIVLDGQVEEWLAQGADVRGYGGENIAELHGAWTAESLSFSHALGQHGEHVYAFFDVTDDRIVYCESRAAMPCDHVRVTLRRVGGAVQRLIVSAPRPGPTQVRPVNATETSAPGAYPAIEGVWRERERGYTVELQLPAAGLEQLAFAVADVDDPTAADLSAVVVTEDRRVQQRTGFEVTSDVAAVLDAMARANLRIWLVDRNGTVIRRTGTLQPLAPQAARSPSSGHDASAARRLFGASRAHSFIDPLAQAGTLDIPEVRAALAGSPAVRTHARTAGAYRINAASYPIEIAGVTAGAALVEQTTEAITRIREIALERLLLATLAAFVCGALILVLYVSRVSNRLRRLRDEAEAAIDSAGRVKGLVAGSNASDEIGDLSRSYSAVLQRLAQYTDYLEHLARRLNHELRTPIAVVRSSLDNLRSELSQPQASIYLDRAESGLNRLSTMLSRMSEATRLEEMMRRSDRELFDVNAVVAGCVEGYRIAYAPLELSYAGPGRPVHLTGVPDLIAQMLDKLIENAAEYAKPSSTLEITLQERDVDVVLTVCNEGPPLPDAMRDRLFESMVSVPSLTSGVPHLGLGLYIVKLIAGFHQGSASAADRADGAGVEVTVKLARYVSDPA